MISELEKELKKTEKDIDSMIYMLEVKRKRKRFLQDMIMEIEK